MSAEAMTASRRFFPGRMALLETDAASNRGTDDPWAPSEAESNSSNDVGGRRPARRTNSGACGSTGAGERLKKRKRRRLADLADKEEAAPFFACALPFVHQPARPLCDVCLCLARYSCIRCAKRLCSTQCRGIHSRDASCCSTLSRGNHS
mmetsp:Transcript_104950/g.208625  ORF Transcript_104950/g.208625 Transcript_104950/m.208625 type:complete len:150 (-) Transcript_104950:73-522(-)